MAREAGAHADAPAADGHACRNCGARATGHYCPNCGQETRLALPTFGTFMREAAGRYVALDGRAWRTLFALVARPGFLTLEYFNGRRRRYIRPARLFLVLYLLLFAIIGLIQSPADLSDEVVFVNSGKDGGTNGGPVEGGADATSQEAAAKLKEARRRQRRRIAEARVALAEAKRTGRTDAKGAPSSAPAAKPAAGAATDGADSPKGVFDDDEDTLIGLDRDLNLTLRLSGADLPVPERVRKRYDQFKKLPKEEKAERLYAGALRYGPYAMVVLLPAFALLLKLAYLGRARPLSGTSETVRGAPRLQRAPARVRRGRAHRVHAAAVAAGAPGARRLDRLLRDAARASASIAGGGGPGCCARSSIAIVYLVLVSLAIVGLLVSWR